ncbi:aceric acid hydrolase [Flavisolibacter ginsenosidimutans]|uniref:Glycoside hydrolase family 127 protein n=1 Tax=Flavisolibacter ginsenosidimutans TaxID=661481 RepID=A0A5B8UG59_9BACT|nr:glycoside hydrolase family 127 protein [Flavisolibacter ginsenosidimutans]QEC55651.1 glycoside hydrolase family 127 protein [Flavisolibacter ginsenosidimutans]
MKKICAAIVFASLLSSNAFAQDKSLTNTSKSSFAKLYSVNMNDVQWTTGFWAERFKVCKDSMVPNMWRIYNDPNISHAFENFKIAAGLDTGSHKGPSFHDGDYYKTLEAVAALYATTKDKRLDEAMDKAIDVIGKSQRSDGYIYTKNVIEQKKTGDKKQFESRLSFEAYNIGHLMTAACVHYRATGKTSLLDIAKKASDYLYRFYDTASAETARNAICPSHYMGLVEMYRTTGDKRYESLAKKFIDVRGVSVGSDDNSDRYRFRDMQEVQGHAVRANYLFAGAADLYAENGDTLLLSTLYRMWDDVVNHKMYITGGCGALYDGVSNDGTSYNPNDVEKLHQAYGRKYQLPNLTAHNETCANIGNLLWNWRMLQITGDAKYADVLETALYNSILSGISLNGTKFLYTNPLAYSDDMPFQQRWSKDRVPYIALSDCCPPNVVRTVAEVSDYMYSLSDEGLYVNLYGGNRLQTTWKNNSIRLTQTTAYPWEGAVTFTVEQMPATASLFLRIPAWAGGATIRVNGTPYAKAVEAGAYVQLKHAWKKGDVVKLFLPMEAKLIESNPLVEETRAQVAVKRGPVVYCLESADVPAGKNPFQFGLPVTAKFTTEPITIDGANIMSLKTSARLIDDGSWNDKLYKEVSQKPAPSAPVRLIPYFAWGNRGHAEMTVWMPVSR